MRASASALSAERMRIEVAVSNLANAESTRGPDGQPYKRRDVCCVDQRPDFDDSLGRASAVGVEGRRSFEDQGRRGGATTSHPDADADATSRCRTSSREEMVDMLGRARAYQANLTAIALIAISCSGRSNSGEVSVPS